MTGRDPALLADKSLPRWWKTALFLAAVRVRNSAGELVKGRPRAAVSALRPMMYCTCTAWGPCTAYYLKGWYAYCPNCGTYAPC